MEQTSESNPQELVAFLTLCKDYCALIEHASEYSRADFVRRTTKELVDLAAGTFSHVPLVDAAKPVKRYAIPSAEEESIVLYPAKSFSVFTYTNQNFDVRYKIDETIKAPTAAEAKFGEISVYRDGKLIKIIDIVSHKPTRKAGLWTRLTRATSDFVRFLSNLF